MRGLCVYGNQSSPPGGSEFSRRMAPCGPRSMLTQHGKFCRPGARDIIGGGIAWQSGQFYADSEELHKALRAPHHSTSGSSKGQPPGRFDPLLVNTWGGRVVASGGQDAVHVLSSVDSSAPHQTGLDLSVLATLWNTGRGTPQRHTSPAPCRKGVRGSSMTTSRSSGMGHGIPRERIVVGHALVCIALSAML